MRGRRGRERSGGCGEDEAAAGKRESRLVKELIGKKCFRQTGGTHLYWGCVFSDLLQHLSQSLKSSIESYLLSIYLEKWMGRLLKMLCLAC
jgi:pyruvate/2-oxoglutarate dehydrogenase complex dihydrolipoamide dehydrogenase (E3) component